MSAEIMQTHVLDEEIAHWVSDDRGYHAYTRGGTALHIVRSASVQPPIKRPEDYPTWLWVEALQGFYLARQRIVDGVPQEWRLVRQLVPSERHGFFVDFQDVIAAYLIDLEQGEAGSGGDTRPAPITPAASDRASC